MTRGRSQGKRVSHRRGCRLMGSYYWLKSQLELLSTELFESCSSAPGSRSQMYTAALGIYGNSGVLNLGSHTCWYFTRWAASLAFSAVPFTRYTPVLVWGHFLSFFKKWLLLLLFLFFYFMCISILPACMSVWEYQISWRRIYRQLWNAMWVLGIEPM